MRKFATILMIIILVVGILVPAAATGFEKKALPSQTKFVMNGKEVAFDAAYNIEDNNYIQLRSVAQMLNGTTSQFNVYWDEILKQAVIETGASYTGVKPVVADTKEYKLGDKVIIKNTSVTINKVFSTKTLKSGDGNLVSADNETFFCVTFTVLTSNPYLRGRQTHIILDFLKACEGESGTNYRSFGVTEGQNMDIYQNQETTTTVYFPISIKDKITNILVSDGQGQTETISVN